MNKALVSFAAVALLCLCVTAQGDVFNLGSGLTNLETITVEDAGNVANGSYGSVGYVYSIGKYEVTAGQYCYFLNAKAKTDPYGLYSTSMASLSGCKIQRTGVSGSYSYSIASDWANRPVNYVTFWDACRFANWLNNGQGNGDTETGAYTLNGYDGPDGRTIQRNAGARWFLPSENEWYKAAYYKGGGTNAGYWNYPTENDSVPSNNLTSPDGGNNANFGGSDYTIGAPYYRTNVGEFEYSEGPYGTFDQGGNVQEWNEAIVYDADGTHGRGLRGGSYDSNPISLNSSSRGNGALYWMDSKTGFRIAATVPEPSSLLALLTGIGGLGSLAWRRTKK